MHHKLLYTLLTLVITMHCVTFTLVHTYWYMYYSTFLILQVRFYAAELVLGLEHIHLKNIVYRDLKV